MPDRNQLKSALMDAENHGYVLFPELRDAGTRQWLKEDPRGRLLLQQLMDNLEAAKGPSPALTFQMFMAFERTGNRIQYEKAFFERRRQLFTLVLSFVISEELCLLPYIEQKLWEWCELTSWELPAHYGSLTKLPLATDPDRTVGLFAAETAFFFAELLSVIGHQLDGYLVYRLEKEIFRRVLTPYLESSYWWESTEMNWSAVCAGSIGAAAIYLVKDPEVLSGILERVLGSMSAYLEGFDGDGLTREGLSYWEYGFSFYMMFFELLSERTNGKVTLPDNEKAGKIATLPCLLRFPSGKFVNFSDAGGAYWNGNPGLLARLSRLFDIPREFDLQGFDLYYDPVCRFGSMLRMLFWSSDQQAEVEQKAEQEANPALVLVTTPTMAQVKTGMFYYQESGWLIDRRWIGEHKAADADATNPVFVAFAAKGGHNEEPHNHNDLGSFLLHYGGEDVLIELGSPEYVKEYFNNETRYNFLAASSFGHSVPVINGQVQSSGRNASARVLAAGEQTNGTSFTMELCRAYPDARLSSYLREFCWVFGAGVLEIKDSFLFECEKNKVEEAFLTAVKPVQTADNKLLLQLSTAAVELQVSAGGQVSIDELSFTDHSGIQRRIYRTSLTYLGQQRIELTITIKIMSGGKKWIKY